MTDRFEECLPFTLAQECPYPEDWGNPKNFSNDANDRGGATMCGIIQREYDIYRKHKGLQVQSVRLISQAEGCEIYEGSYWQPYCPMMPAGLDMSFFDASVNEGTHESIKILQFSLHIPVDGAWGPDTAGHVAAITDVRAAISTFAGRRSAVYRMMSDDRYFDRDWQRRTLEIRDTSLKMVTA